MCLVFFLIFANPKLIFEPNTLYYLAICSMVLLDLNTENHIVNSVIARQLIMDSILYELPCCLLADLVVFKAPLQ